VTKIPIRIEDIEKVPSVSEAIKEMVRSNPNVSFESDAPYCYLSRLENSYGELTVGCNLKNMVCLIYSRAMLLYLFTPVELRTGQTGPWPLLALENFEGSLASLIKNGVKMQGP
jgi:hypothetical protein